MTATVTEGQVLPAFEMKCRLLAAMPEGTELRRVHAATLSPDKAGWLAIDPAYYRPGIDLTNVGVLFPRLIRPARIFLDLLVPPGRGAIRVAQIVVATARTEPTRERELEACVPVDSARLMIARAGRLARGWQVGGPKCSANLLHAEDYRMEKPSSHGEMAAAAKALRAAGFRTRRTHNLICLVGSLSDTQLDHAYRIMRQHPKVELNVLDHSTWVVTHVRSCFGVLKAGTNPVAVVCDAGFGDGLYYWNELLAGRTCVGYRCSFVDEPR